MKSIFKRELKSYFSSPIGYVCVAAIAALYGFMYYTSTLNSARSSIVVQSVYSYLFMYSMMIIPIITMRSMTEDKKARTDQLLLTSPVSVGGIVTGKFLAAFMVYLIASTLGLLPAVALTFFSSPPWGVIIGNYVGALLYGGAMISIGIFISSFTQSQIISAIGSFAVSLLIVFSESFVATITNEFIKKALSWTSFFSRYQTFTQGLLNISNIVFFLGIICIFVFLTARKLESHRWS